SRPCASTPSGTTRSSYVAERSARAAAELAAELPGHPPWGAQADAVLARVALGRGDTDTALGHARAAGAALTAARQEDLHLDILLPIAQVFAAAGAPEWEQTRDWIQLALAMVAQRTLDEDVRVRWFRGPIARELSALTGPLDVSAGAEGHEPTFALDEADAELLRCLIQGRTNAEIAEELGLDEPTVARRLGELFARIGTSSRAEATAFAFRERVL
ncbi:MAG TPA: helix-turn-helix transcriptional regulator, partial [Actinomycetota bacterium]|nr:helix-turn-helix transcriptional regulator [Actinomycetota bacterium]